MKQLRSWFAGRSSVLAASSIAAVLAMDPHVLARGGDAGRSTSAAPAAAPQSLASAAWPKVAVKLVLTGTLVDSATGVPRASTGGALGVGEAGSMSVNSGAADDLCGAGFGAGSPSSEAAYAWRVEANPVVVADETITVAIDWTRSDRTPAGGRERRAGDRRTVTLTDGERHVLDFVSAPRENRSRCANLMVQVEASLADDPTLANASLGYDVWLIDQDAAGHETTRRLQAVSDQGDPLPLTFLPFGWTSDGVAASDPWRPDVAVSIAGTVKGRLRADGLVQLFVTADRIVRMGASKGTTGYGEKRFTARPGEIVRLEIPPNSGGTSFLASHKTFLTVVVHVH